MASLVTNPCAHELQLRTQTRTKKKQSEMWMND
jgi:hypothetical protein